MQGREQTDCFEYALAVLHCLEHDINYRAIIREQILDVWWLGIITCLGVMEECLLGSLLRFECSGVPSPCCEKEWKAWPKRLLLYWGSSQIETDC